jgi:hypothetical protein
MAPKCNFSRAYGVFDPRRRGVLTEAPEGLHNDRGWSRDLLYIEGGYGRKKVREIITAIHVDSGFVLGWQLKLDEAGHG